MQYLHTMVRVKDLNISLSFYCDALGLVEVNRYDSEKGRFTLVFLAAPDDIERAKQDKAPLVELTYNWPTKDGESEDYTNGRNFGHLAYRVDNIYSTCHALMSKGVIILRPPRDGHMAFIQSPDGISIELLQKGDNLSPEEPWVSMENTGSW
ncbi:Lactoylglutathione lyase [gamma proteobacterium IMCC1989]|nr:Lactoylglutathione lyase [gamma proteobacterium IMCC1989]